MSDNQSFQYEHIHLNAEFREILVHLCSRVPRMITWDICNVAADPKDLYNIATVLLTLDTSVSREMEKELDIQPGSDIPEKVVLDVIGRLKENRIWDQLK